LRESEERHRYSIELIDQMIWTTEADGSDPQVAPRFYEVTGLAPGQLPREAVHPDDKPAAIEAWRRSIATGQAHDYEFRLCMRDGSARHFRARAAARKNEQGRVIAGTARSRTSTSRSLANRRR
jgi:PAS domain S-box-containing protein